MIRTILVMLFLCHCIKIAQAEGFDYYKLALSWSPTYCLVEAPQKNRNSDAQCASANPNRFIVHGLWPQYENRTRPEFCTTTAAFPTPQLIQAQKSIVPDSGLIIHQWRKHGTCTGLKADEYFAAMRAAHNKITVPSLFQSTRYQGNLTIDEIKISFIQVNPKLESEMLYLSCRGQKLREVRVCMSKTLEFRACDDTRDMCPQTGIQLPPPS